MLDNQVNKFIADAPPNQSRKNSKSLHSKKSKANPNGTIDGDPPDLMKFSECARDGNVCVKTVTRWVKAELIAEWRPHPKSRTRRIKRHVWIAFKQRFQK